MLNFQGKIACIDIVGKVLALTKMGCDINNSHFQHYIYPMLKHCLILNIFAFISEVLNNLSVSNVNEEITLLNQIKALFSFIFRFSARSQLHETIITLIY